MEKSSTKWRRIRKALGFTQKQVADALGVSANYVWMIEKGTNEPSPDLQEKFWLMTDGQNLSTAESATLIKAPLEKPKQPSMVRENSFSYGSPKLSYQVPVEPWAVVQLLTEAEFEILLDRAVKKKNVGAIGALTHEMKRRSILENKPATEPT